MPFAFTKIESTTLDLNTRAYTRVLSQFRRSQVLIQILMTINAQVQELSTAIAQVISGFEPGNAVGVQQDVLGRIVGLRRNSGYAQPTILLENEAGVIVCTEAGVDVQLDTGLTLKEYTLSDYDYTRALAGKVFRNFCKYGSINEIQDFFLITFNLVMIPVNVGPMTVIAMVPQGTDPSLVQVLQQSKPTNVAELAFYAPYPATLEIRALQFQAVLTEDNQQLITEDDQDVYTEGIEPFSLNGVTYV